MDLKDSISITEKKNTYTLKYNDTLLTLSGNFESGNLNWAAVDYEKDEIQLEFGRDRDVKPSSKCWFYFSIHGSYSYLPVKLFLKKTGSLNMVAKIYDLYRPVVRVEGGEWNRHHSPVEFEIGPDNEINFRMMIELFNSQKVYIALCYPWSNSDNQNYLTHLSHRLRQRKDVYFNRQTLIYTPEKRPIELLAFTSGEAYQWPQEEYMEHLFPNRQQQSHFKVVKKPLVMVTCRVHPGQIGSSYSLKGMIEFLVSGTTEARKILSEFYFLFIPILNPDGVANGNNRMDSLGQNLNRFYHLPDLEKQPSCYAVKSIVQNTRQQLFAFFDLHGHANKKSCFLFGNSITNTRLQVESVLFAKYLCTVCDYVEFKSCNFSKKQMSSKDKNEDMSKEGCARVVVHRWTNSPYCYTLETGLFKNVKLDDKGIERYGEQFYNPRIYGEVGAKMISTLYAILKKDKNIEQMRKQVNTYVLKLQKLNNKGKQTIVKGSKKQLNTMKSIKEKKQEAQVKQPKKVLSEKENQYKEEKNKCIEEILQRNKNYLLSLEDDDQ